MCGAFALGIKFDRFVIGRGIGLEQDRPAFLDRRPGLGGVGLRRIGHGVAHEFAGGAELAEHPQGPQGGNADFPLPGPVVRQGLFRGDPDMINGFLAIVAGGLVFRSNAHKKTGVEASGWPGWRDPVAQVRQLVQGNRQVVLAAQLRQGHLVVEQRLALPPSRVVGVNRIARCGVGQENPGFLEAFPHSRQHVIGTAFIQAHDLADIRILEPGQMLATVGFVLINSTAGEHEVAGQEGRAPGTLEQQHFHAVGGVAA